MSQGKTYVVTGGAGFIGSNIAEALRRRGDRVRVIDNFSTGRRENVESIGAVEVIEGDLRDPQAVRRAVTGADGVFHQAALRSVPRSGRLIVNAEAPALVRVLARGSWSEVERFAGADFGVLEQGDAHDHVAEHHH